MTIRRLKPSTGFLQHGNLAEMVIAKSLLCRGISNALDCSEDGHIRESIPRILDEEGSSDEESECEDNDEAD